MAIFTYNDISITGMSACVPARVVDNRFFSDFFSDEDVTKVVQMTGISHRRWADSSLAASDLGYNAGQTLMDAMEVKPAEVDGLIFCSVTPDYRMPATSFILQDRMGLGRSTLCFDLNMGCSGFVYALNLAYSILSSTDLKRIMLVNSHIIMNEIAKKDRATSLLFGDGATATMIEKRDGDTSAGTSYLSAHTDGAGYEFIIKPGGAYRNPTSAETLRDKVRSYGSIRNDEQASMDGPAIFDFTITEVPKDISNLMAFAGKSVDEIDHFVLHQANLFIMKHIGRKLKVPMDKIPVSLDKYGNLSSVSLPLTIVSELAESLNGLKKTLLLSAFGVGLSWGSAVITLDHPVIVPIVEI
jgi:3-oxoacyl-[acyl-carrier-protein] synthase-3